MIECYETPAADMAASWCSFSGPKGCWFPPLYPFYSLCLSRWKHAMEQPAFQQMTVSNGKCRASTLTASNGMLSAIPNGGKLLIFTEMKYSGKDCFPPVLGDGGDKASSPRPSTPPVGFSWHLVSRGQERKLVDTDHFLNIGV